MLKLLTSKYSVFCFQAEDGIRDLTVTGVQTCALPICPDGRRVVTASFDSTARIWDAKTGQPLTPALKHARQVEDACFSPDGLHVATASSDQTARVWDAVTGEPLTPPLRHDGPVRCVRFSPNGQYLVTASEDHTARIWRLEKTERPITDLLLLAALSSGEQID